MPENQKPQSAPQLPPMNEGVYPILAALLVMFTAMINPIISVIIAVGIFVALAVTRMRK